MGACDVVDRVLHSKINGLARDYYLLLVMYTVVRQMSF